MLHEEHHLIQDFAVCTGGKVQLFKYLWLNDLAVLHV